MNKQFISLASMKLIECGDIWEGGNQVIKIPAGSQGCSVGVGDYERGRRTRSMTMYLYMYLY